MTTVIDTHAHLDDERFQADMPALVDSLRDAGVQFVLNPTTDEENVDAVLGLGRAYPLIRPMIGLHPTYVKENFQHQLELLRDKLLTHRQEIVAIGEIGLDYYWDKTLIPEQKEAFAQQLNWALHEGLPISVHSRESTRDCIDLIREEGRGRIRGVLHCFSGTQEEAEDALSLGLHLGIGGNITYKNNPFAGFLVELPLERLVLETDSPYLAPVPYRGKTNSPAYLHLVVQKIAELKSLTFNEVASKTTENALTVFRLTPSIA